MVAANSHGCKSGTMAGMQPASTTKQALRRACQRRRDALDNRAERSAAICARVTTLPAYRSAEVVHCYLPIRSEVDTRPLLASAFASRQRVVVPIVQRGASELSHAWLTSLAEKDLEAGEFGVMQPRVLSPAEVGECAMLIVPLLAFDRAGHRLGYGRGFYDRLLAVSTAPAIGVAFAAQELAALPHDPHDLPLDWIVTEEEVITVPTTPRSRHRGTYRA